ncbi:MAG: MOSC domain-containing protein [Coriobacteriales bacterium]|nr:MOSC domain-containing protein [Coriobacteriales bacterium]
MAKVISVNTSVKKGTRKHPVDQIELACEGGVVGDSHGDLINRQVSFLADESIDKMRPVLPTLASGDFAENITTTGIELHTLPVGTLLQVGPVRFEVTQIGKECHAGCEIRKIVGSCIMPTEGIFAKVIVPGTVKAGDKVEVLKNAA